MISSFAYRYTVDPIPFAENIILSPFNWLGTLADFHKCKDLLLDSQFFSYDLYVYPYSYHIFLIILAGFKIRKYESSHFLFQKCLNNSRQLEFVYGFQNQIVNF